MDLLSKIRLRSTELHTQTIANRRHFHANPELSFKEVKTARYVKSFLEKQGLEVKSGIAGNGLEVIIQGNNHAHQVVALRADMDALPITELNNVPYKSKSTGVMHACGHDVHTASLLTTAIILDEVKDEFEGSIKLIFQPGEEKLPGGASLMIKEGVMENPKPVSILGQHVMPLIPAGKVGFRKGIYMASADELYVTVKGKGGHAALPNEVIDPILISSHIIIALQQIVSRVSDPKIPSVLSFGKIEASGATNVIPDEVRIEGTFRTLDEQWRANAHKKMKEMAEGLAKSMGGSCDFSIRVGYPFLKNNLEVTERAIKAAEEYLGKENVIEIDIWMAAEDFAYYSQISDACFYRLGTRNEEKGITSGVHTPTFDIDETALANSPGLMAWLAINELTGR